MAILSQLRHFFAKSCSTFPGTTPTEETATAPFESRESGDNDFSSIAEGVRTAEETDDDEDESSLPHVISSIRHPSNNLQEVQPHRSLSSPPFSFAVSKDDYSSIQWQSLNSTKFSLDPNTAKSELVWLFRMLLEYVT